MRRTRDLVLLGVLGALLVVATIIVTVVAPNTPSPTGESQFGGAFFLFLLAGLTLYWALGVIVVLRADGHTVGWLFATARRPAARAQTPAPALALLPTETP